MFSTEFKDGLQIMRWEAWLYVRQKDLLLSDTIEDAEYEVITEN